MKLTRVATTGKKLIILLALPPPAIESRVMTIELWRDHEKEESNKPSSKKG